MDVLVYDTETVEGTTLEKLRIVKRIRYRDSARFDTADEIANLFVKKTNLVHAGDEYIYMLGLSADMRIASIFEIAHGMDDQCYIDPRALFRRALLIGAKSIVVIHNHPHGDAFPSEDDMGVTDRLFRCGALLGIPVRDHIIIGSKNYFSFRERQVMPWLF